jgi:hypothetical protein
MPIWSVGASGSPRLGKRRQSDLTSVDTQGEHSRVKCDVEIGAPETVERDAGPTGENRASGDLDITAGVDAELDTLVTGDDVDPGEGTSNTDGHLSRSRANSSQGDGASGDIQLGHFS